MKRLQGIRIRKVITKTRKGNIFLRKGRTLSIQKVLEAKYNGEWGKIPVVEEIKWID